MVPRSAPSDTPRVPAAFHLKPITGSEQSFYFLSPRIEQPVHIIQRFERRIARWVIARFGLWFDDNDRSDRLYDGGLARWLMCSWAC